MSSDPQVEANAAVPIAAAVEAPATDVTTAATADTTTTTADSTPAVPVSDAIPETTEVRAVDAETPAVPAAQVKTSLVQLAERLPQIIEKAGHGEMWGVDLANTSIPTTVVLQKYLRANNNDVGLSEAQLTSALQWRKKANPSSLLDSMVFDRAKFGDLGFVTTHSQSETNKELVITWNIYGSVKDKKATFGNVEEFIKWRAALMELGVRKLKLNEAINPIPEDGIDPYQMVQVHDYQNVSFFRMDPDVKAATNETIRILSMAYPELLSHKYFVNVPAIMGWVFSVVKRFASSETVRKFHPLTSGTSLANEIKGVTLPKEYGGSGDSVYDGLTVLLTEATDGVSTREVTSERIKAIPVSNEVAESAPKVATAGDVPPAGGEESQPKTVEAEIQASDGKEAITEAPKDKEPSLEKKTDASDSIGGDAETSEAKPETTEAEKKLDADSETPQVNEAKEGAAESKPDASAA